MPKDVAVKLKLDGFGNKIIAVISYDNKNHWGKGFEKLIFVLNELIRQGIISEILFVTPEYLQRHNDTKHASKTTVENSKWYKQHKHFISQLALAPEQVTILTWKDVTLHDEYNKCYKTLETMMYGPVPQTADELSSDSDSEGDAQDVESSTRKKNIEFYDLVNQTAKQFQHKSSLRRAIRYLLDESAGVLILAKMMVGGVIIYPGQLNSVLTYVLETFKPDGLSYQSYKVSPDQNGIRKQRLPLQATAAVVQNGSTGPLVTPIPKPCGDGSSAQLDLSTLDSVAVFYIVVRERLQCFFGNRCIDKLLEVLVQQFESSVQETVAATPRAPAGADDSTEQEATTAQKRLLRTAIGARISNLSARDLFGIYQQVNMQCMEVESSKKAGELSPLLPSPGRLSVSSGQ